MYDTQNVLAQLRPLNQTLDQAKDGLFELNTKAIAFVKERPGTCLVAAVAVGFLIGRLAARA